MTLLVDHCVWRPTTATLRQAGFRCTTLRELGRAEARNGDVLGIAIAQKMPVLTRDEDFLELGRSTRHYGVIYLRITPRTMPQVHQTLISALRQIPSAKLRGALVFVEPSSWHLHRPLRK